MASTVSSKGQITMSKRVLGPSHGFPGLRGRNPSRWRSKSGKGKGPLLEDLRHQCTIAPSRAQGPVIIKCDLRASMGQEILHCSVCGIRLRGSDFEKGEALKIDLTAFCSACAPRAAAPESRPSSAASTRRRKTSTARIPIVTPRNGTQAVGAGTTPPALIWVGGGLLVAILAAATLLLGGHSRPANSPALPAAPAPQVRTRPDPAAGR